MQVKLVIAAVALMAGVLPAPAENAIFDRTGRLTSVVYAGDELAVRGRIQIPSADWTRVAEPGQARRVPGNGTWQGTIALPGGQTARFTQTVNEEGGRIWIAVEVSADAAIDVSGIYYTIDVPRVDFAGGSALIEAASGAREIALPAVKPAEREFLRTEATGVAFRGTAHNLSVRAALEGAHLIALADHWERAGRTYAAVVQMHAGPLPAGQTASLKLSLAVAGDPDHSPARLTLDASRTRYKFQGFGGNYCFNIESPVTQYTLDNLKVAWGRTEMSLSYWEPENDNDSPTVQNWDYFKQRVAAYPRLEMEMKLGRQLQDRGIPYIASIWAIPEWIYTDPGPGPQRRSRRVIALEKMDELVESITSYLMYAKREYGAEPDMFSFNEANIGIDVLLTPEEHRDMIKRLGAAFEKAGLKTRLLLGDATGPQNTHLWALAAAADPEAMRFVKAIGFHSWGGGTPEQYKAWGDLAEWLQLPLLVTELGVDAQAHQGGVYDTFHYGMREVRMYQELLLYARPQGTQQWEFTADYGTVRTRRRDDGTVELQPTSRFWLVKHFTDLTPRDSEALATSSDNDKVLMTAFAKGAAGARVYTLHIANMGAARPVTIEGAPEAELRMVRTSETEDFKELPAVRAQAGVLRLEIPPRSLVTLTTLAK